MKLMPILDLVTDFATFQTYMMQGWYELALVVFGIILATWRFLTVYSALTPKPSTGTFAVLKALGTMLYSFLYLTLTLGASFCLVLLRWCISDDL